VAESIVDEVRLSGESSALAAFLADQLSEQSDALVDEWIDWLVNRIGLRPARVLPKEAIRDHMPPVVRGIAEFLRMPLTVVRSELTGHLRLHAQLRRDQGYDIEELIQEYEALGSLVSEKMVEAVAAFPREADPVEVARVFGRLREGLGSISSSTVSLYRQKEVEHKREMRKAIQEFAQTMAHEVRNPLNSIFAGVEMLDQPGVSSNEEERARLVSLIRRGVQRTVELLDDLTILSLAGGGAGEDRWQRVRDAVNDVIEQLSAMAKNKGVRLIVVEPLPQISLDKTRTDLALVNLVSNAIKYSDQTKAERWVRIGCRPAEERENRWELWVEDNGLGIPESMRPQIFERHFRAHPDVAEGTGLGLAITREVVEQRGGKLWFDSEEGRGSTFHLTLPALEEAS
jgi:signal transduction histidine kinase